MMNSVLVVLGCAQNFIIEIAGNLAPPPAVKEDRRSGQLNDGTAEKRSTDS
jgi:hypothetical protein